MTKKEKLIKEKYASRFVKEYKDRTIAEKILVDCLYHLEVIDITGFRYAGAAESILVIEKVLEIGTDFDYLEKEKKSFFGVKYKEKETYKEFIIRHIKIYLKDKQVINEIW